MSMTPTGYERFSTLSPTQQNVLDQLLPQLTSQLEGKRANVFEAPFKRQFQEETVPGLAERFSGLGAGAQRSSAFQQALGGAGASLAENLAALNAQQQQNAIMPLLQILGMNTEGLVEKSKPWWQEALVGLSGGLGQGLGSLATGGLSSGLGSLFDVGGIFGRQK
ncbi:MAG: hypothetical protein ACLFUW_00220 [Bacteroidales bacterium]